ncbi:hypothetical protein EDD85DRAFT_940593 [Armillaria nabsnona]|nr:hypothetical protein EDD85DRAFT_940593 [Armillaria nabsnona]
MTRRAISTWAVDRGAPVCILVFGSLLSPPIAHHNHTNAALAKGGAHRGSLLPSMHAGGRTLPALPKFLSAVQAVLYSDFESYTLQSTRHEPFWSTPYQAEAELLTWLDDQTNVVSLRFPFLVDDDDDASPPTPLPATPTCTRLLSAPTTPSQPLLFPMPPLSPLPPTLTPTQDTVRPTTTLEFLPTTVPLLRFTFKSVGKRMEEKTLRSAIVVCPAIQELEIEGEDGEECWCSIITHFESLRVLAMRIPRTAKVKTGAHRILRLRLRAYSIYTKYDIDTGHN